MQEKSIYEFFKGIAEANPGKPAYRFKDAGEWISISWAEHQDTCQQISRSLIALGVQHQDKVDILSSTRLEWVQCDMGAVSIGAVTVGIYHSNLAPDCAYIINHSDAKVLFVEDQSQLDKIVSVRDELKNLQHIVIFDGLPSGYEGVLTWKEFLEKGKTVSESEFEKRTAAVGPDDLASIVYTSGTTGVPKGAMLSHENLLFSSWSAAQCLNLKPHYETLLFLPLAHVFARLVVFFCMRNAIVVNFAESMEKIADNLREVRPHFFASVPRIFEKVYDKISSGAEDAGGIKKKLFDWSLATGYAVSRLKQAKQPVPPGLAFKYKLAHKLVFSKIQAALGRRVVWAISGAAPLNITIAEFFHACGVLILEGIGMTENSSFTNVNREDNFKFGTVGQPGPGIEQKLAADGEVLFRGKNVMKGYYKNDKATRECIDKDGWLYTGDIGEIDEENFLKITDRKKDLIITAGGKNVAPQRVEKGLRTSRYVSQVVAYGDRKKYLTALVTLDQEQVEAWATAEGIPYSSWPELAAHPRVKELIEKENAEKNSDLASFETIKKFVILPQDFSIESGELTPSLKIKRKVVFDRYRDQLEALYDE